MKKLTVFIGAIALIWILNLLACTNDQLPEPVLSDCGSTITYVGEIKAIVDQSCAYDGCHVAGFSSGDFSSYEGLLPIAESGDFKDRVITQAEDEEIGMPPDYAPIDKPQDLDSLQMLLMQCWIDGGFLEN